MEYQTLAITGQTKKKKTRSIPFWERRRYGRGEKNGEVIRGENLKQSEEREGEVGYENREAVVRWSSERELRVWCVELGALVVSFCR
jgi:hypothetical protein